MVDVTLSSPASGTADRRAGVPQGVLLVLMSCTAVLGAVLLSPVLPAMQDAFASTPGVKLLVPVTLTVPALMIALVSPFAGSIVDRLGRKRLLVGALVAYGFLGMAPLVLASLPAIVASRVGVGLAEAAIMTCCTTLIVDYFDGEARNRWLGMQTVGAALAAAVFFGVGGALGSISWRAPFWIYGSAFVFAALASSMIWQPVKPAVAAQRVLPPFPVRVLLVPVFVTAFAGVVFYAPVVEVSYVLNDAGFTSTGVIGAVGAVASLSTALGGIAFARRGGASTRTLLCIALGLAGVGLIAFALVTPLPLLIVSVVVACAGTGLLLPTLLTWAVSHLSFDERGRGTGLWTASLFLGQFLCPLLVIALTGLLGGLSWALVAIGAISLLLIAVSLRIVRDV